MSKSLSHHFLALPPHFIIATHGNMETLVTAPFEENATQIKNGGVFVARQGQNRDGHAYIDQAIEKGAIAIVGERPKSELGNVAVPYIQVHDAQQAIGYLSASYHGFPSRELVVIGVTGTDGKTTTSTLIYELLKDVPHAKVGIISTISADFGDTSLATGLHVTTPSAPEVQTYLAMMREAGLTHVVLEMTSHGLAQGRLNGVDIDVAVLTNVTHEHLDYHGSWENYRNAKAIMFQKLSQTFRKPHQPKISVINADDPSCDHFMALDADLKIRYGVVQLAEYQATDILYTAKGTEFSLDGERIHTNLFGQFNVSNTLAAIATAKALGSKNIHSGLLRVQGVSGRMEALDEGQNFIAMVDFAHTPNALKNVLQTARQMLPPNKRLIAVFGSAGLRDVEKRRMMAETSAQIADITILTAEDPRTESLDSILEMMAQGCIRYGGIEGETFFRIPDRGEAIYQACQMAQASDMVVACGKGHEQSMCFGTIEYDWDDRNAMRAALRGHPLKTLPTAQKD